MKKFLTETQVMDLIPNRFPIIYIDYVDEIESGKKIIRSDLETYYRFTNERGRAGENYGDYRYFKCS